MIFVLFLAAFLGLWAVLNFLLKGFRGESFKMPEIKLPAFIISALKIPTVSLPRLNLNKPSLAPIAEAVTSAGIEINNLVKDYQSGESQIRAVDIPHLEIKKGEFLAVIGRSGSGKSSLLNLLGGLDKPTSGEIFIDGVSLASLKGSEGSKLRNQKIGYVFQEANLIPSLTALENVELPLKYSGISIAEKRSRATKALSDVGLKNRLGHFPAQLSGGEAQRVTIARSLVNNPSIVLADEPTGEVDSQTSDEIITLMKDLNKKLGTTFIIVTHDPLVARATNRILRIQDGKVLSDKKIIKIDGSNKAEVDLV